MNIRDLEPGPVIVKGTVTQIFSHRIRNGNFMIEATIADTTGSTRGVWFNKQPQINIQKGFEYIFDGKYELRYGRLALQQPHYESTGRKPSLNELYQVPYVLPSRNYYPTKKTTNWNNYASAIMTILFWIVLIAIFLYGIFKTHSLNNTQSSVYVQSKNSWLNETPLPYSNTAIQGYWYCWNSGPPNPHHLGHYVIGDHLCTQSELGK